jgi:hypothetical protein
MPMQSLSPIALSESKLTSRKWPVDILTLALATGGLWLLTLAWHVFGLARFLEPPIHSETDAWLLALSGIIFIFLFFGWVVSWWSVILGIPTCLLLINLGLRRRPTKFRWFCASGATLIIFVSVGTPFNNYWKAGSSDRHRNEAKAATESIANRPVGPPRGGPSDELSEEQLNLITEEVRKIVDAKCAAPTDPALIAACARQRSADE